MNKLTNFFFTFFIVLLIFTFNFQVFAQHCLFDGGMVVVIHLTGKKGEDLNGVKNIKLVQKDKDQGKKNIEKTFLPTK